MMKKLFRLFRTHTALLTIIMITGLLAWKNFSPDTYLTGWDTLHPEFNFQKAFSQMVNGVWRSDQGLGALAVHSHMSELPRIVILYLSHFVLPTSFLRYFYIFLCMALGPLGMYFFLRHSKLHKLASALGGVFYLLNLITLQHFYVPFEMFPTQFAYLPWLFLFILRFLDKGNKKDLLLFSIFSFLATPMAYAATLFYAYLFGLAAFLLGQFVFAKNKIKTLKKVQIIAMAIFLTNAFWLLPNLHSIKKQGSEVQNSQINTLFSPEARLRSEQYANALDVFSFKSFLFSWREYDGENQKFVNLMDEWVEHSSKKSSQLIQLGFVGMCLLGLILALKDKNKLSISMALVGFVTLFFLIENGLYKNFSSHISLLEEGFRMPFTKFSLLFLFVFVYFWAYFLHKTLNALPLKKVTQKLLSVLILGLVLLSTKPAFGGNFISKSMRVDIPGEYFESFNWFNQKENGRMALLPMGSPWGWQHNSWGYEGAGFYWFGINNPFLTRDFDRWNKNNETFYNEVSFALYDKDFVIVESLLTKYRVNYLLVDESIISPQSTQGVRDQEVVNDFLKVSKEFELKQEFGFLKIYQRRTLLEDKWDATSLANVNYDASYGAQDLVFSDKGNYLESHEGATYPFINTKKVQDSLKEEDRSLLLPIDTQWDEKITIPAILEKENTLPVSVQVKYLNKVLQVRITQLNPSIVVDGKEHKNPETHYTYSFKNLQARDIGFVAIGEQVFNVEESYLNGAFHAVGTTVVNKNQEVNLAVFSAISVDQSQDFRDTIVHSQASLCRDPEVRREVDFESDSVKLVVSDESVCIGNEVVLEKDSLVSFGFESFGDISPYFCATSSTKSGCLNNVSPTKSSTWGSFRSNHFLFPLESDNYWFAFVGQAAAQKGDKSITYGQFQLATYQQIQTTSAHLGKMFGLYNNILEVELKKDSQAFLKVPKVTLAGESFRNKRGMATANNCDLFMLGEVSKTNLGESIRYKAEDDGVICDYFDYPLSLENGILLKVSAENRKGRGMKLYISPIGSTHIVAEILLPGSSSDTFLALPFVESKKEGYVINTETRSFGAIESENILHKINLMWFPNKWLSSIAIPAVSQKSEGQFLILSESFDEGWIALSGNKLLPHYKINSWANGWQIEGNKDDIKLFYLPQILEYIGLALLVLFFVSQVWNLRKRVV